uniref:Uncharacterized protein n=1 Tax=Tanacetum cinerariifolium TaxID=118510 RepID=A0A699H7C9_TANCI|nr:hypothetical protein [Tanacetum cinerariifolium]
MLTCLSVLSNTDCIRRADASANDDNGQERVTLHAIQNVVVKQVVFQHMIISPHISDVQDVTDSFVIAVVPTVSKETSLQWLLMRTMVQSE